MILNCVDIGICEEITDLCAGLPNAAFAYEHAVQLPMHEGLAENQVRRICRLVNQFR
jgi:dTDP-4-amino-4,6-dideoxygalactose transaminase